MCTRANVLALVCALAAQANLSAQGESGAGAASGAAAAAGVVSFERPTFLVGGSRLDAAGLPEALEAAAGERAKLTFYYVSPEDNAPGEEQLDHLQGLSMVLCLDCRLRCDEASLRVGDDTITAAIGADFVTFQCDGDDRDGDGCEMSLAILAEARPPFDGTTLPPTGEPLKLASVELLLSEELRCGEELPLRFCNGLNIRGTVPLRNLYAADDRSFAAATADGLVKVVAPKLFRRGDCNLDARLNITDAVDVLIIHHRWPSDFEPLCLDACDVDDDGRINIPDALRLLRWLFLGGPVPPLPGPFRLGRDPSLDGLGCELPCAALQGE